MLLYVSKPFKLTIDIWMHLYLDINLNTPLHIGQNQCRYHWHISWPQRMHCEKDDMTNYTLISRLDVNYFSCCLMHKSLVDSFTRNWSAGWRGWNSTTQRFNCRNTISNPDKTMAHINRFDSLYWHGSKACVTNTFLWMHYLYCIGWIRI